MKRLPWFREDVFRTFKRSDMYDIGNNGRAISLQYPILQVSGHWTHARVNSEYTTCDIPFRPSLVQGQAPCEGMGC